VKVKPCIAERLDVFSTGHETSQAVVPIGIGNRNTLALLVRPAVASKVTFAAVGFMLKRSVLSEGLVVRRAVVHPR
jgi:hypothetical protein